MAKKETEPTIAVEPAAEPVKISSKPERAVLSDFQRSVYTPDEFAAMHEHFGTTADIVKTALILAKVEACSVAEAEKIIKKFIS